MSYVMREWYGIFWHFLIVFGVGVVIGMILMSVDSEPIVTPEQVQYTEADTGLTQNEFTRNWCEANYGTGESK